MKPRQLYSVSTECGNYEELSTEQKKRTKIDPCIKVCQAETEVQLLTIDDGASVVCHIKTPMDRLLNNLETTIRRLSADLENKETTLTHLNDSVKKCSVTERQKSTNMWPMSFARRTYQTKLSSGRMSKREIVWAY